MEAFGATDDLRVSDLARLLKLLTGARAAKSCPRAFGFTLG